MQCRAIYNHPSKLYSSFTPLAAARMQLAYKVNMHNRYFIHPSSLEIRIFYTNQKEGSHGFLCGCRTCDIAKNKFSLSSRCKVMHRFFSGAEMQFFVLHGKYLCNILS